MSGIHNGGRAFPCTNEQFTFGNPQTGDAWPGMTLRDWFAGHALAGDLAASPNLRPSIIDQPTSWATDAGRAALSEHQP